MQKKSASHQQECINACFSCAQICETCADDMIGMAHDTHDDLMTRCIRLCRDCGSICLLAAQWLSRGSQQSESLCRLCAEICDQCAGLCERHAPRHPLCAQCAEECRRCAESCREMMASGVHTT